MAILDVRKVFGVVGSLPFDPVDYCILAAGTAIAWAYCFELTLLTFYTFRRWSGLYFYSLLISSWGCTFHALGFILKFLTNTPSACFLFFIETGKALGSSGSVFVYPSLFFSSSYKASIADTASTYALGSPSFFFGKDS